MAQSIVFGRAAGVWDTQQKWTSCRRAGGTVWARAVNLPSCVNFPSIRPFTCVQGLTSPSQAAWRIRPYCLVSFSCHWFHGVSLTWTRPHASLLVCWVWSAQTRPPWKSCSQRTHIKVYICVHMSLYPYVCIHMFCIMYDCASSSLEAQAWLLHLMSQFLQRTGPAVSPRTLPP